MQEYATVKHIKSNTNPWAISRQEQQIEFKAVF